LDPPTTEAFLHCLAVLNRHEGVTLFCVTHDLTLMVRYATHLVLLSNGKAIAGPAQEVMTGPTLASVYGTNIEVSHDTTGTATVRVARLGASL
jgi:iron complex transport system ATP-binding protein